MPLLGRAAIAMWWEIEPELRAEFEDWHSHEHLPERLGIPGFLRGSRWAGAGGGEGFFVMYEVEANATLTSPAFLARLNDPTPWSTRMMPNHRNMVRSQCRVVASFGGGIAGLMLTLRLSPDPEGGEVLRAHLESALASLPALPGITGSHLLRTRTPELAATREQQIRGGDAVADWIVLVSGYDAAALRRLTDGGLGPAALAEAGATPVPTSDLYGLAHTLTPADR